MVSKPYGDDDDDAPTLQRAVSQSGPVARLGSGSGSGLRPAVALPALPALHDAFDEDEAPTEVDKVPRCPPVSSAEEDIDTARDAVPADALPADALPADALPADFETDTPRLPVDIAAVLRRASAKSEPEMAPETESPETMPQIESSSR